MASSTWRGLHVWRVVRSSVSLRQLESPTALVTLIVHSHTFRCVLIHHIDRPASDLSLPVLGVIILSLALYGCDATAPSEINSDRGKQDIEQHIRISETTRHIQDSLTTALLSDDEIVGFATTVSVTGEERIVVLAKTPVETWKPGKRAQIPLKAGGVPVHVVVTGEISAPIRFQGTGAMIGAQEFGRPVPTGVSTGTPHGLTGTIGARVTDGESVFALSNNHVLASINSGNIGDPVLQPGPVDGGTETSHTIGGLTDFEAIDFSGQCVNTIDAAIAQTTLDQLTNETPVSGYGVPWSSTSEAVSGMQVQKYGRTSGLTYGSVVAVNATVEVGYGNAGVACFTDQIIISPGEFSEGGDSGSLVVTSSPSRKKDERPVGLLFAGSPSISVANDIDKVLSRFNVQIDGRELNGATQGDDHGGGHEGDNDDVGHYDASPHGESEFGLDVENSSGQPVELEVCAYASATTKTCGVSANSIIVDNAFNWAAEMEGGNCTICQVILNNDTPYIVRSASADNAVYLFRETGSVDGKATLTVNTGTESFSEASSQYYDIAVVTTHISAVSVGTPHSVGQGQEITWDADWQGGGEGWTLPSFFPQNATIKIIDGANETTITTTGDQDDGSGSFVWTPTQTYSDIQIKVVDNGSGNSASSSTFSVVDQPLTGSITGPSSLAMNVEGNWSASGQSGVPPYTYDWDFMWVCNAQGIKIQVEECDTWNQGGTGSSWSKTVSSDFFDMKIRMTITDSDLPANQDIDSLIVDIYDPSEL